MAQRPSKELWAQRMRLFTFQAVQWVKSTILMIFQLPAKDKIMTVSGSMLQDIQHSLTGLPCKQKRCKYYLASGFRHGCTQASEALPVEVYLLDSSHWITLPGNPNGQQDKRSRPNA